MIQTKNVIKDYTVNQTNAQNMLMKVDNAVELLVISHAKLDMYVLTLSVLNNSLLLMEQLLIIPWHVNQTL